MQEYTLQYDNNAQSDWPHQAGGGRPGGASVCATRQDRLLRRSAVVPLPALRARLHHSGAPHTAVSLPLRIRPRLRDPHEDLQLQLARESRVLQVPRAWWRESVCG